MIYQKKYDDKHYTSIIYEYNELTTRPYRLHW